MSPSDTSMFNIVLVAPEIPPNTGNVIRLAANTGCTLHLIDPLGFDMNDKLLRRAGLDYHEWADVRRHADWGAWRSQESPDPLRCFAFTTRAARVAHDVSWRGGDWLIFGSETSGLPASVRERIAQQQWVRLPMRPGQRSLNLSNAVAVAVFEAWRQNDFAGGG
jgi:tRNA (cytidine/uridine-2'-O-)-methyltransferase